MPSPNRNVILYKICKASYVDLDNGTSYEVIEGPSPDYKDILNTTSVTTPGYRTFKNKFYLPDHSYDKSMFQSRDSLDYTLLDISSAGKFLRRWDRTCVFEGLDTVPGTDCDDPSQRLSQMVLQELNSASADTLTSLAEMNRTCTMVSQTASAIASAISNLRRGRLGGAMNALGSAVSASEVSAYAQSFDKAKKKPKPKRPRRPNEKLPAEQLVASTWLNYSYGWKPLLNDVYNQMQALASANTAHNDVARVVRKRFTTSASKLEMQSSGGTAKFRIAKNTNVRKEGGMVVYYRYRGGDLNPFLSFGIQNPQTVLWEVMPFSFVIDWFLPVGQYLQSLTSTVGLEFLKGSQSLKTYIDVSLDVSPDGVVYHSGDLTRTLSGSGKYHSTSFRFQRLPLATFPPPELPKFKDPRSLTHALSAIALLSALRPK
jgi:hypothetical protein